MSITIDLNEQHLEDQPNTGQSEAIDRMVEFIAVGNAENEFVLAGAGGTGKTWTMPFVLRRTRGDVIFTAPTNKATKVLRNALRSAGYTPSCRTIFSLLGLRMEANGEIRELSSPEEPVDLGRLAAVVVDEASMENIQLREHIRHHAQRGVKFLHMGDYAQLNPVGERLSKVWELPEQAELTEVKRNGGAILELVNRVREQVDNPIPRITIEDANDGKTGVWRLSSGGFFTRVREFAAAGKLQKAEHAKIIAWRNTRVDQFNSVARQEIFGIEAFKSQWLVGDRLILTAPAKDFGTNDGEDKKTIAHTDDEGSVERVDVAEHPMFPEVECWRIVVTLDDNKTVTFWAPHESCRRAYELRVADLADLARATRRWDDFWEFKEAFHQCRHAYAITAHRAQGSTYEAALVEVSDILVNRTKWEAFRALNVGLSRPRKQLFVG